MGDWIYGLFGICMISSFVLWLVFTRFTMARIEKQIKQDQLNPGFSWDGVGGRTLLYAYALLTSERHAVRMGKLVDVRLIKLYANRADWWLALLFIACINTWILVILLVAIVGTK